MNRPRAVTVVSAIASSTAAFVVLSRWQLFGTLTGAVLWPAVATLVTHCSTESFDHVGRWVRDHGKGAKAETPAASDAGGSSQASSTAGETIEPPAESRPAESDTGEETGKAVSDRAVRRRVSGSQWLLATFAALALGMSLYSVLAPGPVEQIVLQERVIEHTVTVTTVAEDPADTQGLTVASLSDTDRATDAASQTTGSAEAQKDQAEQNTAAQDGAAQDGIDEDGTTETMPEEAEVAAPEAAQAEATDTVEGDGGGSPELPGQTSEDPEQSTPASGGTSQDPASTGGDEQTSTPPTSS